MTDIIIEKYNSVYNKIHCEPAVAHEISDHFTFQVPGAKFIPAVRQKKWDGKIRLFNKGTHLIYGGLNRYIEQFANDRDFSVGYLTDFSANEFSVEEARQFYDKISLVHEPRDYQTKAFVHAVRNKRALLLSPTASGKSLIIFLLVCYVLSKTKRKILIVVPTVSLVHQMVSDFASYTNNQYLKNIATKIMYGHEPEEDKRVVVSTWQSIYKAPQQWFNQFSCVVGDECHLFKAGSLTGIMNKMINCDYRVGFTGTLDGTHTNQLVIEGLFGDVKRITTTTELINQQHLASFDIKCIILKYPDVDREHVKTMKYHDEIDWIVRHTGRNRFIKNLALSLEGNTLILFQFVEKHGKELYASFEGTQRDVVLVYGAVDGVTREEIRIDTETAENRIIIASYGTFSTGVNVKNLHNVIFASPSKSRIRNLQSIGRVLRKGNNKDQATLYDIADDLTHNSKQNTTLQHFAKRLEIYGEEMFEYKIYNVQLAGESNVGID